MDDFEWMTPTYNKQELLVISNKLFPTTIDNNDYLYFSTCIINIIIMYTFGHIVIYNTLCTGPLDY